MLLLEPYPHQLVFLIVWEKREIRRAQKLYFLIISVPTGFSEIWWNKLKGYENFQKSEVVELNLEKIKVFK